MRDDSETPEPETEDLILSPDEPVNYNVPQFMLDVSDCFSVQEGIDDGWGEKPGDWSGIYYLMASQRLVYIGQSSDILKRIATHKADRKMLFTHAFWTPCGEQERMDCEMPIIRYLKPHYNKLAGPFTRKDRETLYAYGFI